jgi:cytochrome c553
MKRIFLIALMLLTAAGFASAQIAAPSSDVLGAHLNFGRGCAGCHAPHSGAAGAGVNYHGDTTTGDSILWGEDVGGLYGKPLTFAGNTAETLPTAMTATTPDVNGLLTCLSCHDGNYAKGAMMKNKVYETLPSTYGTGTVPTLLGNDGTGTGANAYLNDHPVGLNAAVSCGGQYNWDCVETAGKISMTGPNSSAFVKNYGFFVSLTAYNNTAVVTCTSCHNQHLMNVVSVTAAKSGLPAGNYATMFFLRAPYNPASGTAGSNQTAQFCRQCHGGEANESNGSYSIPTTF